VQDASGRTLGSPVAEAHALSPALLGMVEDTGMDMTEVVSASGLHHSDS